jgi:hypothetical protein
MKKLGKSHVQLQIHTSQVSKLHEKGTWKNDSQEFANNSQNEM